MKRELPVITIEGTDFIVDVIPFELREKENPENVIPFENMRDVGDGYTFEYSPIERNLPSFSNPGGITVKIPEWVELDPVGMAEKYGLSEEEVSGKIDFELMVDQEVFESRVKKGILPTVNIAGHIFYVDLRMDMLRPQDNFLSKGIVFSKIEPYYLVETNQYIIPYNPKTHEFQELDWEKITEYPKELIAAKFPGEWKLDPVGWNRLLGLDLLARLKYTGLQSHFNAEIIPWDHTFMHDIVRDNRLGQNKPAEEIQPDPDVEKGAKKGRKL